MERLQKFLSRAGVASRRAAEALIVDGQVKVNGVVVTELGSRVDPERDLVVLNGQPVTVAPQRQYFVLYKPPGVVTTLSDPQGRATVADFLQKLPGRVYPVGRLDFDAEGALLITDDGELANQLMHPSHQVPRVYLAKVKGEPDQASLDKLVAGVRLEDGLARAVEVRRFEAAERNTWLKLVVTEGRQHLVKRLCAAIGHPVVRLFRPAHAGVSVQGLRPGQLRPVSEAELRQVRALVAGAPAPEVELFLPGRRHGHGYSTGLGGEPEGEEALPTPPPAPRRPAAAAVEEVPERPEVPREYVSRRGPEAPRPEKPAAVGAGHPVRGTEDRGGAPARPAVARGRPDRFAPRAPEDGEGAGGPEAAEGGERPPRRREPGAFGRGGQRPDGRLGAPARRPRYGTQGPGGRAGKPGGAPRSGGPRREGGAPGSRFARPEGGARSGGPRREGGAPGGRFARPEGGARSGGPRREGGAPGGRFARPEGGARSGGPRREGGAPGGRFARPEGGARSGGPRREGGAPGSRFARPEGGARSGGPRREGGAPGSRFARPEGGGRPGREGGAAGGARFGGPRRPGGGGGRFGKPAGGPRAGGPGRPGGGSRPGGRRPPRR